LTHIPITTPIVPAGILNHFWILDQGSGFASETETKTAARRFQKRNGRYETVSEVKRLQIYSGYV
jgi:hypothetical protein